MLTINDVNPIGIGTFMLGGGYHLDIKRDYADYGNDDQCVEAIQYSLSKGQNHIDTAYSYSDGHTEELVGRAIKGLDRSKIFISDKISKGHMLENAVVPCVKKILKNLDTEYIDLLYAHTPKVPEPMSGYIAGMNQAVDLGLVKYIGVSNFNLEQLKEAVSLSRHPIVANQIQLNLLDRTQAQEELLVYCRENNIKIVAYQPLQNKVFFNGLEHPVIKEVAEKYGISVFQLGLNWIVKHKSALAIPKAVEKAHIDENLAALDENISEEDFLLLDGII